MLLRLKVDCQELKRVFGIVSKSVRVQDTILSNVLLTVNLSEIGYVDEAEHIGKDSYTVYLHARNVNWSVTSLLTPNSVELSEGMKSCAVLIDSKVLGMVMKSVKRGSTGEVVIEIADIKNGMIEYQGSIVKFSIPSNAAFPETERERKGEVRGFEIMSSMLLAGLSDGSRGCSKNFREKTPSYIHEILFEVRADNNLRLVSTDGRRMAMRNVELVSGEGEYKFSVNDNAVRELVKLLEKYKVDDTILVSKDDYDVYFVLHQGNTVYKVFSELNSQYSQMVNDGSRFPNYERILPEGFQSVVRVNKGELVEALTAVYETVYRKPLYTVLCRISDSGIKISGKCDGREIVKDVNVQSLVGNGLYIAYCISYLLEGLASFRDDESVVIKLNNSNDLTLFVSEVTGYQYLLAPCRLGTDLLIDGVDDELKKKWETEGIDKS